MNDLVKKVIEDPENDLRSIARAFLASGDAVWHIDRHTLGVDDSFGVEDLPCIVASAIELARMWNTQRRELPARLLVSRPYVVVDDDFLTVMSSATPPHVYTCLATEAASFSPVSHEGMTATENMPVPLEATLAVGEALRRVEGALPGEPGAWIIELP